MIFSRLLVGMVAAVVLMSPTPLAGQIGVISRSDETADNRLFGQYLRNRIEALLGLVEEPHDENRLELAYSVMPLSDGLYDVTVVTVVHHVKAALSPQVAFLCYSTPDFFAVYHNADDLEKIARDVVESLYEELEAASKR